MAQRGINLLQIILVTSLSQGLYSTGGDNKTLQSQQDNFIWQQEIRRDL